MPDDIETPPKSKRGGKREGAGRKPNTTSDDIAALFASIAPVKVGRNEYTRKDRYRDFNRVLYGTAEGRRVLAQIIDVCEGPQTTEADIGNHALLAGRAMTRRVGQIISAWASIPPGDDITK